MFQKILIANRGEIAVRITRTVQQMGIAAVAVHSDPDREAPHVAMADEAYPLEGSTSAETYLRGEKMIEIAERHGADAIHPGYGFLSENAAFAEACAHAGMTFIGPSPDVIRTMGDKLLAKKLFADAGVPVVPGWSGDAPSKPTVIARAAREIGYPVLIKAAAGGGGRGMRVVRDEGELAAGWAAAQREAQSAFGDGRVFLEKYISRPRHVEFQIFGDSKGNVVHLFERECSIQRRHQKIVEESPSPALTPEMRARMGDAAVRAAEAIGYTNAGTVEFMVDESGNFYFLEVNTRLQVEHPVTELIAGHDLIEAQVRVAAGEALPFRQDELVQRGHAIEVRVYAEDASRGFVPSTGLLRRYVEPTGPGVRVDSGVREGSEVTVYYDPMLAKLIVHGRTRDEALARLRWALDQYVILGVTTNIEFLRALIDNRDFRAGRIDTQFLETHEITPAPLPELHEALMATALYLHHHGHARDSTLTPAAGTARRDGPWRAGRTWRNA